MRYYPVKLYEDEMTRIEGALLKACDGSAASQMLIQKIRHKRERLVETNKAILQHDKAERKQHGKRVYNPHREAPEGRERKRPARQASL